MSAPTPTKMRIVFEGSGTFEALNAALRYCGEHGISAGTLQRGAPIGLMRGDYLIQKWRNLSKRERAALDGALTTSTGSFRDGPVVLEIFA